MNGPQTPHPHEENTAAPCLLRLCRDTGASSPRTLKRVRCLSCTFTHAPHLGAGSLQKRCGSGPDRLTAVPCASACSEPAAPVHGHERAAATLECSPPVLRQEGPGEGGRHRNGWLVEQSGHSQPPSAHLTWVQSTAPQNNYSTNIKNHRSQVTRTRPIITKRAETGSEHGRWGGGGEPVQKPAPRLSRMHAEGQQSAPHVHHPKGHKH